MLGYQQRDILDSLDASPMSATELADDCGIDRTQVYDLLKALRARGFVVSRGGRPVRNHLTDEGRAALRRDFEAGLAPGVPAYAVEP